jgi:hypothetical protein
MISGRNEWQIVLIEMFHIHVQDQNIVYVSFHINQTI